MHGNTSGQKLVGLGLHRFLRGRPKANRVDHRTTPQPPETLSRYIDLLSAEGP
jgi:hypothetical protein